MSDDERREWETILLSYPNDEAVCAILDRVEQLERELAAAREELDVTTALVVELPQTKRELAAARKVIDVKVDALRAVRDQLDEARGIGRQLNKELAACQTARNSAQVMVGELQRELAAAREAYDSLSETDTKLIGQLRVQLAATRTGETPCPA